MLNTALLFNLMVTLVEASNPIGVGSEVLSGCQLPMSRHSLARPIPREVSEGLHFRIISGASVVSRLPVFGLDIGMGVLCWFDLCISSPQVIGLVGNNGDTGTARVPTDHSFSLPPHPPDKIDVSQV